MDDTVVAQIRRDLDFILRVFELRPEGEDEEEDEWGDEWEDDDSEDDDSEDNDSEDDGSDDGDSEDDDGTSQSLSVVTQRLAPLRRGRRYLYPHHQ